MRTLAERLAWARTQKGLSQDALANEAKVSQSTIGNLEANIRQTARKLPAIAHALGVSSIWLAEGKGPIWESIKVGDATELEEGLRLLELYKQSTPAGRAMIMEMAERANKI